jgi:hypothetical protein
MLPVLKRSGDNWNLLRDAWIHLQNRQSPEQHGWRN